MFDPLSYVVGVGLFTNLVWHPLWKALDSDTFKRFCVLYEDLTRQRTFARIFDSVRERLPAEKRCYINP